MDVEGNLTIRQLVGLDEIKPRIPLPASAAQPPKLDCKTCSSTTKTLIEDFDNLFEEKNFADFTFIVEGTEFPVHKVIISARCAVFAAMLHNDMKEKQENRAVISDISAACFKEMLRFLYTGNIIASSKLAAELFEAADKYDLPELTKLCEDILIGGLTCENAISTFLLVDSFSNPSEELKTRTIKYIQKNRAAVMKSKDWIEMVSTNPYAKLVWSVCSVTVPAVPVGPVVRVNSIADIVHKQRRAMAARASNSRPY